MLTTAHGRPLSHRRMGRGAAALLLPLAASVVRAADWHVLLDTDFADNGGGPASPAVKGTSAADCADKCQKLPACAAVVWNAAPGSDHGCNFKCDTKGQKHKVGEQAVIVRKDLKCPGPPPPPPPPPPPSPSTLCPDSMPADWKQPCLAGDLFYQAGDKPGPPLVAGAEQVAEGDVLNLMPTIGNGYLAMFVASDAIYAAGLFNGDSMGALGPVSHRAAIPAYHIQVGSAANATVVGRALDVRKAVFMVRSTLENGFAVEERWYAPLDKPSLLVHEMTFTAASGGTAGHVGFSAKPPTTSPDLNLTKLKPMMGGPVRWNGSNVHGELGNATTLAMVATDAAMEPLIVAPGSPKTAYFLTAIVTSLNSTDPLTDATKVYEDAMLSKDSLLDAHVAGWAKRWEMGSLEVAGDLFFAQALNASLYAIRASIREDWPYGLSPGGLASNAYEGHTFWDQETWMWPPLLMLDPGCAKSALDYRWNRRSHAHDKAVVCGTPNHASSGGQGALDLPDDALMFPWESCLTGTEVQFGGGKIGEWGEFEQHISGDIVLAARQYWYATGDKDWLTSIGFPLAKGVAEFYAKRAVPRSYKVTTRTASDDAYDINDVMGPDEYAFPVNNSAYTNAAAIIALSFATEAAGVLGESPDPAWATVAAGLSLEVAPVVPNHPELQGGYHPEYKGFPKNPTSPKVKQADTILLSYPLGVNMSQTLLRNDLTFYDPITDPGGPAMTWAMFAIGWINVGDFNRSAPHFQRGYSNVHPPFNVWTESPNGGTINFITGAGGFLQSAIFGTSGMRLVSDGLTFNPPPPRATGSSATMLGVSSFHFRGHRLSQQVTEDMMTYSVVASEAAAPALVVTVEADGSSHPLAVGSPVSAPRGRAKISLK